MHNRNTSFHQTDWLTWLAQSEGEIEPLKKWLPRPHSYLACPP